MALNAKKIKSTGGGVKQPHLEAGGYPARVVQVIDCGVQKQRPFKGEAKAPAHEIMITYELLDAFCVDKDGNEDETKPRWLSETFPLHSLQADLAKSTKRYKAIDPEDKCDGDFTLLVGSACNVTVTESEKDGEIKNYVGNVTGMRARDAAKAPDLVNEPKVFVLDEPDMEVFGSLPQWLQDKIKDNLDFDGSELDKALNGGEGKPQKQKEQPTEEEVEQEEEEQEGEDAPW